MNEAEMIISDVVAKERELKLRAGGLGQRSYLKSMIEARLHEFSRGDLSLAIDAFYEDTWMFEHGKADLRNLFRNYDTVCEYLQKKQARAQNFSRKFSENEIGGGVNLADWFEPGDCDRCDSTGWVTIYHPKVIHEAMADPDNVNWRKTVAVKCRCRHAEKHASEFRSGERKGKPVPVFGDQPWHIRVRDHDSRIQAANYEPVSARAKAEPNYSNALEDWNHG